MEDALTATSTAALADRPAVELSDGERQRVMIARALAQEPRALLLDEPTAFLDVRGRLELTQLLLALTQERGLAVLMSTHDLEHMLRHADRVWLIDHDLASPRRHDGRSGRFPRRLGRPPPRPQGAMTPVPQRAGGTSAPKYHRPRSTEPR